MITEKKILSVILLFVAIIFLSAGCAKKEVKQGLPQYPDWLTYSYKHFVFHYPPDCYWGKRMEQFSNAFERYLTEDCEFLAMEIPPDTIHFYIHDNPESGKILTGRDLPFSTENQIHWDRHTPFGLELARYLIKKMNVRMTDFKVLYEGLATLLDYSGGDYHHNTYSLFATKMYIPLDSLFNNDSYDRTDSFHRAWEGASLVGFITYNFGINRFIMLWQSTAGFSESVKQLFGTDMKKFEEGWLKFAETYYQGIETKQYLPDSTGELKEKK